MDALYAMKKEMLRRRYSIKTIKAYSDCVSKLLMHCPDDIKRITKRNVMQFLNEVMDKEYSGNTINVYFNAVKYFIGEILHKRWTLKIKYSKTPKISPEFLEEGEVIRLLSAIENKKHKLMVSLMYAAGLRVSELVNLKAKDLNFDTGFGWVRHGKGNKDRMFIIAERLKDELAFLAMGLDGEDYLFKGLNGHISVRSIQEIVRKAAGQSGIKKNVHPHTLRHSFATHIIMNKGDIISVQTLLGHKSAETTMGYVHSSMPRLIGAESPFDRLSMDRWLSKEDHSS